MTLFPYLDQYFSNSFILKSTIIVEHYNGHRFMFYEHFSGNY